MNLYHVTWIIDNNPILSTGKTYKASNMKEALLIFNKENPNIEPLYIIKIK